MAVLSNADRAACSRDFQVHPQVGTFGAVTKANILAAVNALDDFLETNAATINSVIPQPARGVLTVQQKALLLQFVIEKRYIRS